jgi:putative flippase GtrA
VTIGSIASDVDPQPGTAADKAAAPELDVAIPVYNEETAIESCVRRLHAHLSAEVSYPFRITVVDNASTDATQELATALAAEFAEVLVLHLTEKGKGRALRAAWLGSDAQVLAYMDVDLSTDLAALSTLVAPLRSGHSDLAIGTRLHHGARVVRGARRAVVSRGYNLVLRGALSARFSDGGCGFKAIRREVADELIPLVEDNNWFFDTELLVLAEHAGLRIHEVPVDWIDDPNTKVKVVSTATEDLRGIVRLARALFAGRIPLQHLAAQLGRTPLEPRTPGVPPGLMNQLVRFGAIGVFSTLAYLAIFIALRSSMSAQGANLIAVLTTTVANTSLNRRFTFRIVGRHRLAKHQLQGLIIFGLALSLTSTALFVAHSVNENPTKGFEVVMVVSANAVATVIRFLLLRRWVFRKA